jgi:hypothetical protein
MHSLARIASVWARCHRRSANQCAKPLAETRPCHAAEATGTVPATQTAIRSRAHEAHEIDERKTDRTGQESDKIFASLRVFSGQISFYPKKSKKNVLTPETEIWYHAPLAPKQAKDFTR